MSNNELTPNDLRQMVADWRGGIPDRCDFCGLLKPRDEMHPDECDMWICSECIERIGYQ